MTVQATVPVRMALRIRMSMIQRLSSGPPLGLVPRGGPVTGLKNA